MADWILPPDYVARRKLLTGYRAYRSGVQEKQLKIAPKQSDDNITMNFTGLVIDRSMSMLFGKGVTFDYESDEVELYLNEIYEANRKEIMLHKIGLTGGESGTWYIKIIPNGLNYKGKLLTRLVVLDPQLMTIETKEDDIETVTAYNIIYAVKRDGKDKAFCERTYLDGETWKIVSGIIKKTDKNGIVFETIDKDEPFEYPFCPILHGQNLPNIESVYGDPDVTPDVIELQDRLNLTSSNISKILRLHAHPIFVGEGYSSNESIDIEPGKLLKTPGKVYAVEMSSDLASSQQYLMLIRQGLFDITRTVDISSMNDKLGALTNFGLRVLYQDSLAKNETKKQLYGDGLLELNRRLLVIGKLDSNDEGHIEWPDPLPTNEQEEITGLTFDLDNGLVSKETVSEDRGYIYANEQPKIEAEKSQGDNIGAALLANFTRGQ
jgi:hypothetical protein